MTTGTKRRAPQARARSGPALRSGAGRAGFAGVWEWLPAVLAMLLYLPVLRAGFVWDDHSLIEHRLPQVGAGDLPRLLSSDFWMVTGGQSGFWRPAIVLSYWLDGRISGLAPGWFHGVNLVLHAIAAACLVWLLREIGVPRLAAVLAGLVFASFPAHVEAVAWISGRADVASTLFVILALALDARGQSRGRDRPGFPALIAFTLALLCKESAVLFVPIVAALRGSREPRRPGQPRPGLRAIAIAVAPYLGITIVYLVAHAFLVPTPGPPGGATPAVLAEVRRAAWTAFPRSLAFLMPWASHGPEQVLEAAHGTPWIAVTGGIAVHALAAAACVVLITRRSVWAAPLLLLWLPSLPPLVGMIARGEPLYAERLFHLSTAGAAWALGMTLAIVLSRGVVPARVAVVGAALLVAAGAWGTWRQLPAWRDDEALYRSITHRSPRSARGHIGLAEVLAQQGRDREAALEYDRAAELEPWLPYVHVGRALLAFRRARWRDMLSEADRALALDSLDLNGRLLRATALLRLQRPEDAMLTLEPIRALRPDFAPLDAPYGQALLQLGRTSEAIPHLESAAHWVTDDVDLDFALATAYARERRFAEARDAYARTLAIDPNFYDAWLRFATACQVLGDFAARDQALAHAAALPQARDGRVEALRRELTTATGP